MRALSLVVALHGSGPALLRTRLRSSRARLHCALAGATFVQLAGAQVPAALFGGDLLSSLGGHLAAAMVPGDEALPGQRRARDEGVVGDGARRDQVASRLNAHGAPLHTGRRPVATLAQHRAPRNRVEAHDHFPSLSLGAAKSLRSAVALAPLPLLARQIQEYAALGRANRLGAIVSTTAPPALPAVPPESRPGALRHSREEAQEYAVLESFQRFTGATLGGRAAPDGPSWRTTPEPAPAPAGFHSHRDRDAAAPRSLWGLSERMADMLRAQARQHGIDLT